MYSKYTMTNYNNVKTYWTGGKKPVMRVEIPGKNCQLGKSKFPD